MTIFTEVKSLGTRLIEQRAELARLESFIKYAPKYANSISAASRAGRLVVEIQEIERSLDIVLRYIQVLKGVSNETIG